MDIRKVREVSTEDYLTAQLKLRGGLSIKLNANWYKGIPDRLCVWSGHVAFVELKRPVGGKLSVTQKIWKKFLTNAGASWFLLKTRQDVDNFFRKFEDDEIRPHPIPDVRRGVPVDQSGRGRKYQGRLHGPAEDDRIGGQRGTDDAEEVS